MIGLVIPFIIDWPEGEKKPQATEFAVGTWKGGFAIYHKLRGRVGILRVKVINLWNDKTIADFLMETDGLHIVSHKVNIPALFKFYEDDHFKGQLKIALSS